VWQAWNLHASGLLQSLFWTQWPPRSSFLELPLHEAAATASRQVLMSKLVRFISSSMGWFGRKVCHKMKSRARHVVRSGRVQWGWRYTTTSRRAIVAASKAPKFFGHHGAEGQHRAPAGGPAVGPGDIATAS
jgi:hypothetical protein